MTCIILNKLLLYITGWSPGEREQLGEELSDILIYLLRLAERCHVDLPSAVMRKFALNAKKYPVQSSRGSSLKYTAYQEHRRHDDD